MAEAKLYKMELTVEEFATVQSALNMLYVSRKRASSSEPDREIAEARENAAKRVKALEVKLSNIK